MSGADVSFLWPGMLLLLNRPLTVSFACQQIDIIRCRIFNKCLHFPSV